MSGLNTQAVLGLKWMGFAGDINMRFVAAVVLAGLLASKVCHADGQATLIISISRPEGAPSALYLRPNGIAADDKKSRIKVTANSATSKTSLFVARVDPGDYVLDATGLDPAAVNVASVLMAELPIAEVVPGTAKITLTANQVLDLTEDQWRDMIDTNLTGVWHTVKAAVPNMVERGEGGSVIFTGSTSSLSGYPNVGHYVAAKHGIVGLMHTLANELGPKGIRVNAVHPTNVNTKLLQNETFYALFRPDLDHPTLDDSRDAFATMHSLPNIPWVEPIDITNAIIFLASDESRYVTGTNLPIDAGASQKVGG